MKVFIIFQRFASTIIKIITFGLFKYNRVMKLSIEYNTALDNNIKLILEKELINIGSDSDNDIIFYDKQNVSANHALIVLENNEYKIYNHSFKGTYVNKIKIHKASLPHNGILKFGFAGPNAKFEVIDDGIKRTNDLNQDLNRRWYDKKAILSKALKVLHDSKDDNASQVAENLVKIIEIQDPSALFVRTDINLNEEIKSLPRQCRWYDLNKIIQKAVESIKYCKPEMQEKLSSQMIMLIDSIENPLEKDNINFSNSLNQIKCPRCKEQNSEFNVFCLKCGYLLE
jgi:hypothetical protein